MAVGDDTPTHKERAAQAGESARTVNVREVVAGSDESAGGRREEQHRQRSEEVAPQPIQVVLDEHSDICGAKRVDTCTYIGELADSKGTMEAWYTSLWQRSK